jgi:hypothetical protein
MEMQRLRAIERDWSTINDMRQDFESTKAKLKCLMHRELGPKASSHTCSPRCTHVDRSPPALTAMPRAQSMDVPSGLCSGSGATRAVHQNASGHQSAPWMVASECSKPDSQWRHYEQRLRAREAEAEAAELRAEVRCACMPCMHGLALTTSQPGPHAVCA